MSKSNPAYIVRHVPPQTQYRNEVWEVFKEGEPHTILSTGGNPQGAVNFACASACFHNTKAYILAGDKPALACIADYAPKKPKTITVELPREAAEHLSRIPWESPHLKATSLAIQQALAKADSGGATT